jgi:hypothetical protein
MRTFHVSLSFFALPLMLATVLSLPQSRRPVFRRTKG